MAGFELRSTNLKFNALGDNVNYAFDLKHKGFPVFKKTFNGSDSAVVDISNDQIIIPQHFFITGEELTYNTNTSTVGSGIRIDPSSPGVGGTDFLPSTVYAIKVAENKVRVAAARSFALSNDYITITGVGIGTTQSFKANKENTKAIITLDGVIQSPLYDKNFTTTAYYISNTTIDVVDPSYLEPNELVKIGSEIMRVRSIGVGNSANRLLVDRSWAGTSRVNHITPVTLTHVGGNYNINGDRITFVDLPTGWRGGQIGVKSDFFNTTTNSFTFLSDEFQAGTEIKLLSGFPPIPLENNEQYFLIQNTQNNFSFARDRGDAIAGINTIDLATPGIGTHLFIIQGQFPSSSKFQGRFFIRSDYSTNFQIDDISDQFTGAGTTFSLKSAGVNTVGMSSDFGVILINNIFQRPSIDYNFSEVGSATSITFTGATNISGGLVTSRSDVNTNKLPRRGIIVSVGSTSGTGYQPQYPGVGTAVVSGFGTISGVSIAYTGSGYRNNTYDIQFFSKSGLGTGAKGTFTVIDGNIDTSSIIITNPGFGYTWTGGKEPEVQFEYPLPYDDMSVIGSSTGIGASVSVSVGIGTSVTNFTLTNNGYNYRIGDELTVVGLVTDKNATDFSPFKLTVTEVQDDEFAGWTIGKLKLLDDISNEFDGVNRIFTLKETTGATQNVYNVEKLDGSSVDLASHLVIFLNDVLQEPEVAYTFAGGNELIFTEAPKVGSKMDIFVYLGTDADVEERTEPETIKPGDKIQILKSEDHTFAVDQDRRYIRKIENTTSLKTPNYSGIGISSATSPLRPIIWTKQQDDVIVGGEIISKSRQMYKSRINPTTRIIKSIGTTDSDIYAESGNLLFTDVESPDQSSVSVKFLDSEFITRQAAIGTATISGFGTVSSITLSSPGAGFWKNPTVVISGPTGVGTTAIVTASVSAAGTVTGFIFTNPGTGYTFSDSPQVFIDIPPPRIETRNGVSVDGDFGIITGIGTTAAGLQLDFYIPLDSPIRQPELGSKSVTGLTTSDYFILKNTNIGSGVTALSTDGLSTIGIATQFLDGVFTVSHWETVGSGTTIRIHTRVATDHGVNTSGMTSGIGTSFGEFSWARFSISRTTNGKSFTANTLNGLTGLSTAPLIIRSSVLA